MSNNYIGTISYKEKSNGVVEVERDIATTAETWDELLLDFAVLLNDLPDNYNYTIDIDILRKHIENAVVEQIKPMLQEIHDAKG